MAKLTSEVTTPARKTLSGIPIEPVYGPADVRGDEDVIDIVIVAAGIRAGERQLTRAVDRRGTAMTNENRASHVFSAMAAPLCVLTSAIIASHAGTNPSSPSQ